MLKYPAFWQKKNIISLLLWPLALIYQVAGYLRNKLYKPILLPFPVICVGNITVGGTGKTQIVKSLAKELEENNYSPIIISHGYKGKVIENTIVDIKKHNAKLVGDEAFELASNFPVIVVRNYLLLEEAIKILSRKRKSPILIFDDGMQSPKFHKDIKICVIDGDRGFGNNMIFPAGPLRTHSCYINKEVDFCIIVGVKFTYLESLKKQLKSYYKAEIIASNSLDHKEEYIAFSGLGNNKRFFDLLTNCGIKLIEKIEFPDHYEYSVSDLEKMLRDFPTARLITTKKDLVKIPSSYHNKIDCLEVKLNIEKKKELFNAIFKSLSQKN